MKTLTGKMIEIHSRIGSIFVEDLKRRISESEGIPVDDQRLVFEGKQLENGRMLSGYGIKHDSTIYLILKLRGGKTTL